MVERDGETVGPIQVAYELEDLLERMAEETFLEAVDFGPAVGREFW